jgi:hypothetical protein
MSRRASLLLAVVVLAFTVGAAMHAAASVEMSFKMVSTATEAGSPPCDGCGDGGDGDGAATACPDACVASAMPAVLFDATVLPVAPPNAHRAPPGGRLTGQAAPPEPFPPRST